MPACYSARERKRRLPHPKIDAPNCLTKEFCGRIQALAVIQFLSCSENSCLFLSLEEVGKRLTYAISHSPFRLAVRVALFSSFGAAVWPDDRGRFAAEYESNAS